MMKRALQSLFLCAITWTASTSPAATAAESQSKLRVELTITPDHTLPGLSVPLHIRITNDGQRFILAPGLSIRATPEHGDPFLLVWGSGRWDIGDLDTPGRGPLPIETTQTVELTVPALDSWSRNWATDSRLLAAPGVWKLEVLLYDDDNHEAGPVATSTVAELTIETPNDRDTPIWHALQEKKYPAEEVYHHAQDSPYFPYFAETVPTGGDELAEIAIIRKALEQHPDTPIAPRLHCAIAGIYKYRAIVTAQTEHDLDKAMRLADKGRAELELLQKSGDGYSRIEAANQLADYPDRGYLEEMLPSPPKRR